MAEPVEPPNHLHRGLIFVGVLVLALAGVAIAAKVLHPSTTTPQVVSSTQPTPTPGSTIRPSATSTALGKSEPTLVLGDSLALDVYPYLANLMPDRYVSYVAKVGRSTPQIAEALAMMTEIPNVVIVSAGTNDWAASDFTTAGENIMTMLGPHRCVVWMDIARPQGNDPNLGTQEPASAINAALDALAAEHTNIHIMRWSALAAAHPEWFGHDGIHPNDDGIKVRANEMANAALQCSALDPSAPPAPQETLPADIFN